MILHTVRGKQVHGLIIDPGAASGVIGTYTCGNYMREVLWPSGMDIEVTPSTGTFTGIDGEPQPGLGKARMPLGLPGLEDSSYTADLIGGNGSSCPGLLPNSTLVRYQMTISPPS